MSALESLIALVVAATKHVELTEVLVALLARTVIAGAIDGSEQLRPQLVEGGARLTLDGPVIRPVRDRVNDQRIARA